MLFQEDHRQKSERAHKLYAMFETAFADRTGIGIATFGLSRPAFPPSLSSGVWISTDSSRILSQQSVASGPSRSPRCR